MNSIWSEQQPRIPAVKKELRKKADVVVIGGGMAGLLCAFWLKEAGISTVILEADRICSGQTKNTTAKITSQHGLIYSKITRIFGEDTAIQYARLNERAIDGYEYIVTQKKLECEFERLSSYLYTRTRSGIESLKKEYEIVKKAGIRAELVEKTELPFEVELALKYEKQAQFHPLQFAYGIAADLEIYEKIRVIRIMGRLVETNWGTIEAEKVVIATHFPFINFPGYYFARMHQERSYVVAVKSGKTECPLEGMYYGIDPGGLSFRRSEDQILVGGRSERTGVMQPEDPYEVLRREIKTIWPQYQEHTCWAAQDCMTLDGLPYIGKFAKRRPDWYVATGFGKWGMTNAMISALAIRDLITGNRTDDWSCVSPQRPLKPEAVGAWMQEMKTAAKHFVTFRTPRCSHLGCKLVWNRYEKTWDCPCHGSRFAKQGGLIDNPAQISMKQQKHQ